MKPKLLILCFFFILIGSSNGNLEPINLECEFTYHEFATVQKQYTCFVKNDLNISSPNVSILNVLGNHTENKTIDDVKALVIESKVTEYLPANIGNIFTNLIVLKVKNGRLKEIIKEDLSSMPKLKYLNLDDNDIQVLHDDVFEFNPQLELLWLSGNKIEHIGENLVENFKKLFSLYLTDNICTNKKFSLINSNHASLDASSTNRHVQNKFKTLSDIMQDCANFTQNILPVDVDVNEDDSPKLKVYKEQIKSLDSQLVSTKSELKSLKLKFIDEMSAKNLTIDKLNELKREENEVDTGRLEELENKLKKEEKEMRNLKDELKKFKGIKDEFSKLKSTVKSYEQEKYELSSQIEKDQLRMRELEAEIARLREENESLKKLVPKTDIENEIDGQVTTRKSTSGDNVEYEFIPLTASTTTKPSRQPETKESFESIEDTTIYDYYS